MALITTVGGVSSDSYGTLEEANTYFDPRPQSADWEALGSAKETWLLFACDRMEQESYQGERTEVDQALSFPRMDVVVDGILLDDETIPARVKTSQFKLALLLSAEDDPIADTGLEGFERLKVDVIELVPRRAVSAGSLPAEIRRELGALLSQTSTGQFKIFRG